MTRLVFRSIAKLTEDPVEIFWLAGFRCNERNEWQVRVVYRSKRTGRLIPVCEPIGMLPILSLGTWFDYGVMQMDARPGSLMEAIVTDVGRPEVITSADMPSLLYPLPETRAGHQRLFRYRTREGLVHIPAVELIRALFLHNRALALALMRPAGLEQLYVPMSHVSRDFVTLRFTREIARNSLSRELALEFAWLVLDPAARSSWESVRRLSAVQDCILFEPPTIRNSSWRFRGLRQGSQVLVLELIHVGGRTVPVKVLEYMHPDLKKALRAGTAAKLSDSKPGGESGSTKVNGDIDVADGDQGSSSYRNPVVAGVGGRRSAFDGAVKVIKKEVEVESSSREPTCTEHRREPRQKQKVLVTAGERAGSRGVRPIEFRLLSTSTQARIGDLVAFDETVRHMRDKLPHVQFSAGLIPLKQGKAAASVGTSPRSAMVVRIDPLGRPPIVLIDIDHTGIAALSLMALYLRGEATPDQVEQAIGKILVGWVNAGGHWSAQVEVNLEDVCRAERIPKAMVPREEFKKRAEVWALRLIDRLAL